MFHKRGMLQCLLPTGDKAMRHQRRTEKNLSYTGFSAVLEWHWLPRTVNSVYPFLPLSFLFLGSGRFLECLTPFTVTSAGCTLFRLQDMPRCEVTSYNIVFPVLLGSRCLCVSQSLNCIIPSQRWTKYPCLAVHPHSGTAASDMDGIQSVSKSGQCHNQPEFSYAFWIEVNNVWLWSRGNSTLW